MSRTNRDAAKYAIIVSLLVGAWYMLYWNAKLKKLVEVTALSTHKGGK